MGGAVVEPNDKTIVDFIDRGEHSLNPHVLWITNRSSVPIVVTAVTLRDCENAGVACGQPLPMEVTIAPGQRRQVLRVKPASESGPMRFDYSFAWRRADAAATP